MSSIQGIIAPSIGVHMKNAQHWGCTLWTWASNECNALKVISMLIRSNSSLYNFCPWNSLDWPPWVARNLMSQKSTKPYLANQASNRKDETTSYPATFNFVYWGMFCTLQVKNAIKTIVLHLCNSFYMLTAIISLCQCYKVKAYKF